MIDRMDLKQIVMLGYLTDEMLDQLVPITESMSFDDGEMIFQQGETARYIYMLTRGKVLLEQRITENITVSVSAIKPGYAFGWSAMLDEETYTSDAICAEPSQAFLIQEDKLKLLFEKNHSLGFIMSQRLLRIIKKRLDIRTEQFIKTITHHPDIRKIL